METYVHQLVLVLRGFAYVSMVLALLHAVHDFRSGQNVTKYIVYLLCLTAFLAFYDQILDFGRNMFDQGVNEARQNTYAVWDAIDSAVAGKSGGGFMEKYILTPFNKGLLFFCRTFHFLSGMVQNVFIIIYRISAPLVLGMAAWRVFISTGIRFAAGTLWLCCWSVGCAIADIILLKILMAVLAKSMLTGTQGAAGAAASRIIVQGSKLTFAAVRTATLWAIFFALIIFLVTAILLYILVPISLYHIICAGDVVQGATHAMTGAIGGGMAANQAVYRTFANRGSGGGTGNVGASSGETVSGVGSSGGTFTGSSGSGNTKAARSHAALAEAAERQLENRV